VSREAALDVLARPSCVAGAWRIAWRANEALSRFRVGSSCDHELKGAGFNRERSSGQWLREEPCRARRGDYRVPLLVRWRSPPDLISEEESSTFVEERLRHNGTAESSLVQ